MLPTRMEAERLLEEAEKYNPGPWGNFQLMIMTD